MHHAWYSPSQANMHGTVIWKDPNGKEVECSWVTSANVHGTVLTDMVYLGEVDNYIRQGLYPGTIRKLDLGTLRKLDQTIIALTDTWNLHSKKRTCACSNKACARNCDVGAPCWWCETLN